jgi:hypothetical protein
MPYSEKAEMKNKMGNLAKGNERGGLKGSGRQGAGKDHKPETTPC